MWTVVMPFGVPQFAQGLRARGALYAALQAVGVASATATGVAMWRAAEAGEVDTELTLRLVSAGCVAFAAGGWFASTVDAANLRQRALDGRLAAAVPPGAPVDGLAGFRPLGPRGWRPAGGGDGG